MLKIRIVPWMITRICEPLDTSVARNMSLDTSPSNPLPMIHSSDHAATYSSDRRAVVSGLYSDQYAIAVAVLGHSLKSANVSARFLLPYLDGRVSSRALCIARTAGWEPHAVPYIPPPHSGKGIYYRFKDVYTKLNLWSLDQIGIDHLVYLDADTLVRRNFDELFDTPFNFAAVPDVYGDTRGFSITFNTGVLVVRPNTTILENMEQHLEIAKYPPGEADQAFLNLYFGGKVVELPYAYNANIAIKKRSPALWEGLMEEMRVVHYSLVKPFFHASITSTILTSEGLGEAMARAGNQYDGLYRTEVGWWRDAYNRMKQERGDAMDACFRD